MSGKQRRQIKKALRLVRTRGYAPRSPWKSVLPPLSEVRGGGEGRDSTGQHDPVRLADKLQRTSPGAGAADSAPPKGEMGTAREELGVREDDGGAMPSLPQPGPRSLHWGFPAKGRCGQNYWYQ